MCVAVVAVVAIVTIFTFVAVAAVARQSSAQLKPERISDEKGTLLRIDPATNSVRAKIAVPPGSLNPLYSNGTIWITGNKSSVLTPVDAKNNEVRPSISVGPNPRFLTAGARSIWTLNQDGGTITRVDAKSRRLVATVAAGIPGTAAKSRSAQTPSGPQLSTSR